MYLFPSSTRLLRFYAYNINSALAFTSCKNNFKFPEQVQRSGLSYTFYIYTHPIEVIMSTGSGNGKRKSEDDASSVASKKGHWALGLLQAAQDPALVEHRDDLIVIIKDKYPKARHHYLALPHLRLASLKSLTSKHLSLLEHMHAETKKFTETKHPGINFRLGYHAIPSMAQVHLHAISDDFDSPCLKTKKHWNSFNTKYFVDSEDVISDVRSEGRARDCPASEGKRLLDTPLRCHKCSFQPANMPKLKQHILTHIPPK